VAAVAVVLLALPIIGIILGLSVLGDPSGLVQLRLRHKPVVVVVLGVKLGETALAEGTQVRQQVGAVSTVAVGSPLLDMKIPN
jgi:hypothetical protein